MTSPKREPCELVMPDYSDCGAPARFAISVQANLSDRWVQFPVCVEHLDALGAELGTFGFFQGVTVAYDIDSPAEQEAAELQAERMIAAAPARDPWEVPRHDDE